MGTLREYYYAVLFRLQARCLKEHRKTYQSSPNKVIETNSVWLTACSLQRGLAVRDFWGKPWKKFQEIWKTECNLTLVRKKEKF